nr:MAG TPA: large terminase [Caudoviricetes sp.]
MKTWLISVFSVLICTLKPGTKIIVAAKRKKQAQKIITDKIIGELYKTSEALQKEIKDIQINSKEVSITFWNGSRIEAIVANQDARGEFRPAICKFSSAYC